MNYIGAALMAVLSLVCVAFVFDTARAAKEFNDPVCYLFTAAMAIGAIVCLCVGWAII